MLLLGAGPSEGGHDERGLLDKVLVVGLGGEVDHLLPTVVAWSWLPQIRSSSVRLCLDFLVEKLLEVPLEAWHLLDVVESRACPVLQYCIPEQNTLNTLHRKL